MRPPWIINATGRGGDGCSAGARRKNFIAGYAARLGITPEDIPALTGASFASTRSSLTKSAAKIISPR
jgi:hypothetical protein